MNFESRNPATGELLGVHPEHDKAETDARLQRAWDGWRRWSRTPMQVRIAFLTRLANLLEDRALSPGVVPATYVTALSHQLYGSWPLYGGVDQPEDAAHMREYARLAKTAEGFRQYLERHVLHPGHVT